MACGLKSRTLARSYAYCERLAQRAASNFYPTFRILPAPQRRSMCALYAFMRVADDLGDTLRTLAEKEVALTHWRRQLGQALQGEYTHPIFPALHDTVTRYQLPEVHLQDLLDGIDMDLRQPSYGTFAELYGYCYRVASAVGLSCIHIWGCAEDGAKDLAEKAGIAFQLTNILRDVREDAGLGRIYLPREDLEHFGYGVDELQRCERNDRFRALMRFQVERARGYYAASAPLAGLLPAAGRAVFLVMKGTYQGLLDAIEQRAYDVYSSRVQLSRWRRIRLAMQAVPVRLGWM
jgi:phytoene synthase